MIRSRTGGDGSLDFFDDEAPATVVGAVTKDGITGAAPGDITSDDITDAGAFGKTMLQADSNGTAWLDLGVATAVQAVVTADTVADARTALGAGTSNLALGTTATTAAAGNHTHAGLTADQVATTASVRTLGTGAQQAAAGNHTHTVSQVTDLTAAKLMTGSVAATIADPTDATTTQAAVVSILAVLKARGVIASS